MIQDEKFNQIIWWVLQEINKEYLSTHKDQNVYFEFQSPVNNNDDSIPPIKDQKTVMEFLKNKEAIKVVREKYSNDFLKDFNIRITSLTNNPKPIGYFLEILQPQFDKIYLNHKNLLAKEDGVRYSRVIANKLNFYPENGDAEYKTALWQFKGKARAFLTILFKNKNMNFNVGDIKKECNPLITIIKYQFKSTKDINDTLREIRFRLKANKGELFPIFKQENGWIWLEK